MTEAQIVDGFIISLNQLIPNTKIDSLEASNVSKICGASPGEASDGFFSPDPNRALIWFSYENEHRLFFLIQREEAALTENELKLLGLVPEAIRDLGRFGSTQILGLSLKYSSKIGFGDLLIARFLGGQKEILNNQISLFLVLQDLSFRYYEDKRCSSGFVFTDEPQAFLSKVRETHYAYYPFDETVPFHYSLFSSPASFRYVDGRNSYYVIDHDLNIHGIVRLQNPDSYSLVARLKNQHLRPLIQDMPGQSWVAFVGLKEEVYVILTPEIQMKWARNHWQLRDRSIILAILSRFGLLKDLQDLFVSLLFALSEGGYGASLLIPENPGKRPTAIGKIDHTAVGDHLRKMIQRSNITDLNATNSLLGIIASDGLTTISKEGLLLSCGDIIDISEAALLQSQGGGRSQAGIAASFFGLSIKISQNGPISFYYQGKLLLQF